MTKNGTSVFCFAKLRYETCIICGRKLILLWRRRATQHTPPLALGVGTEGEEVVGAFLIVVGFLLHVCRCSKRIISPEWCKQGAGASRQPASINPSQSLLLVEKKRLQAHGSMLRAARQYDEEEICGALKRNHPITLPNLNTLLLLRHCLLLCCTVPTPLSFPIYTRIRMNIG